MIRLFRRWGLTRLAAVLGCLLLVCGIAVSVVDAYARSNAATAAVAFTPDDRERLENAGSYETAISEVPFIRRSLILQSLSSGGHIPEHYVEIVDIGDGNVSVSWGARNGGFAFSSWGGWQLKPVGILTFAGLSLIVAAGFAAASRRDQQHPPV